MSDAFAAALADRFDPPAPVPGPLARYHDDPVGFARDMVDWRGDGLSEYQAEILGRLVSRFRVAVRGPHGLGKTSTVAVAVLWFALTRDEAGEDWKIPVTASAWLQLTHYLWPEIHKWAKRLRWDLIGRPPFDERNELLNLTLKLAHGEAFSSSPTDAAKIEGAHAQQLLFVYDEAKTVPAAVFDATEGAFAGAGADTAATAYALAVSTPGEPRGRFYEIHSRKQGTEDWSVRHVTRDEAVAAGRMSAEWADARERQWGAGSAVFQNRVLGEFATADTDGVIPLGWVEAANRRWVEAFGPTGERFAMLDPEYLGVDCSGSGSDRTVLVRRAGPVLSPLERPTKTSREVGEEEMATAGRVVGVLQAHPGCRAIIDAGGLGSGVVGRVREQVPREQVVAFVAGGSTTRKDRTGELGFANVRSAAWWNLREMLDPDGGVGLMLPPDDELTGDLTAPHWREMSGGRIQVESKDELRKASRLGRSTDAGDACVQVCWRPESSATVFVAPRQTEQLARAHPQARR